MMQVKAERVEKQEAANKKLAEYEAEIVANKKMMDEMEVYHF